MMCGREVIVINNSRSAEAEVKKNMAVENHLTRTGVKLDKIS